MENNKDFPGFRGGKIPPVVSVGQDPLSTYSEGENSINRMQMTPEIEADIREALRGRFGINMTRRVENRDLMDGTFLETTFVPWILEQKDMAYVQAIREYGEEHGISFGLLEGEKVKRALVRMEPKPILRDAFERRVPKCPACMAGVMPEWGYCPHCGQALLWENGEKIESVGEGNVG